MRTVTALTLTAACLCLHCSEPPSSPAVNSLTCKLSSIAEAYASPDSNVDEARLTRLKGKLLLSWLDVPPSLDRGKVFARFLGVDGKPTSPAVSLDDLKEIRRDLRPIVLNDRVFLVWAAASRAIKAVEVTVTAQAPAFGDIKTLYTREDGALLTNLQVAAVDETLWIAAQVERQPDDRFVESLLLRGDPTLSVPSPIVVADRQFLIGAGAGTSSVFVTRAVPNGASLDVTRIDAQGSQSSLPLQPFTEGTSINTPLALRWQGTQRLAYSFGQQQQGAAQTVLKSARVDPAQGAIVDATSSTAPGTWSSAYRPWMILEEPSNPRMLVELGSLESQTSSQLVVTVDDLETAAGPKQAWSQAVTDERIQPPIWQDWARTEGQMHHAVYRQFAVGPQSLHVVPLTCSR